MSNIWEFLLQTLTVSMIAALLLLLKWLMEDKLSPRWQYSVWIVFALRALLPVNIYRTTLLPLPLWVEIGKARAEEALHSAYTAPHISLSPHHVLPIPPWVPRSLTDWLFVIYAVGVVLCALWYLLSYLRLRRLLRRHGRANGALQERLAEVGAQYGLKPCPVLEVQALLAPFVCGMWHPVMAIPADTETDDKILLHELLHLKYRDAWQNVFWCALRCLHWCNPFLHRVIHRIENDMESLCDQRVLERLEGEERRAYGTILLAMSNDRYARAPGSTSISNGGRNIARRIAAIVRFKKYPRGMALVSVCIVIVLLAPSLVGVAHTVPNSRYQPEAGELQSAMALTRLRRCTTVAGAIDTYAKGLLLENGIYIATASPLARQEELIETMSRNPLTAQPVWFLDAGDELTYADPAEGYDIYEMIEQEDGSYLCYLLLSAVNDTAKETAADNTVVIPLRLFYDDGWCAEEVGARTVLSIDRRDANLLSCDTPPFTRTISTEAEHGTLTVTFRSVYHIDNRTESSTDPFHNPFSVSDFVTDIRPHIEFYSLETWTFLTYTVLPDSEGHMPQRAVGLKCAELADADDKVEFPDVAFGGYTGGGDSNGNMWSHTEIHENWDGAVDLGNGSVYYDINSERPDPPSAFWIQIWWDGEVVEELILEEVAP